MNKKNKFYGSAISLSVLALAVLVTQVNAETLQISGNGADSNNSIQLNQNNNTSVNQTNQANVNNDVNITSNTGGNSINGGVGDGSIKTGNINNNVEINNQFNTNNATVNCKNCPTSNPTPTSKPGQPTPTTKPGVGGNGGGTSGGSSSGGAGGSSSGGQILGLPTTSGENELANLLKLLPAFGSLLAGFSLLRKNA